MTTPCTTFAQEQALAKSIAQLNLQKTSLTAELQGASPAEKPGIAQQIKTVSLQLQTKKKQLEALAHTGPIAPVTMRIRVSGIACNMETSESTASDEPYILIHTVHRVATTPLPSPIPGLPVHLPLPQPSTALIGPFPGMDAGEVLPTNAPPFWGINPTKGAPQEIAHPDDVVILVAVLENDDCDPAGVRTALESVMAGALLGTISGTPPLLNNPSAFRTHLLTAIQGAVTTAVAGGITGFPFNFDDRIGPVQELRLTHHDLRAVMCAGKHQKFLMFLGEGGVYRINFALERAL